MKTRSFQLKEILANPFRRTEKYPLLPSKIDDLVESIEATDFWENVVVRINEDGKPELAYGHHRLAALKQMFPGTKEFDWIVRPLTDGVMIQMMARENGESYKTDASVLRETILAAVEAHGAGKIAADEMPIDPSTNKNVIRYAPGFGPVTAGVTGAHPYTVEVLAKFLGMVKTGSQTARDSFVAAFGAVELISEGYLTEERIKGLEIRRLGEVVSSVKLQRTAALKEATRLAKEAEEKKQEAIRKAEELKKQQEEAEEKRKAAAEAERLAAIERAKEKVKRDAEEAERKRQADIRKQKEDAERAVAEAKRKEEEEKQRKIRVAQREEAEKQRVEAERVRKIAFEKAKKEEDERKAEKMRKDAEAAKGRAEQEAKRKEEAVRQAEVKAKKEAEEAKERQAVEKKKRQEREEREAIERKVRQEEAAKKEQERVEENKRKAASAAKLQQEAAVQKQKEIDAAEAQAKETKAAAEREVREAKVHIKAGAAKLVDIAKDPTLKRDDINHQGRKIFEEEAAKVGRKAAPRSTGSVTLNEEQDRKFKAFLERGRNRTSTQFSEPSTGKNEGVPDAVLKMAKSWVESAYRENARLAHPDHGGSHEKMQLVNATAAYLRMKIAEDKNE